MNVAGVRAPGVKQFDKLRMLGEDLTREETMERELVSGASGDSGDSYVAADAHVPGRTVSVRIATNTAIGAPRCSCAQDSHQRQSRAREVWKPSIAVTTTPRGGVV